MKAGIVTIIGRPNVGKSTLLNNLLGRKVSITSPKPQTTRFNLEAVYEDDRGQIIFVDTPGVIGKVQDPLARKINSRADDSASATVDAVLYIVDHTRERSFEENKTLGVIRKIKAPKILVINKIDVKHPSYLVQYKFLEDEFDVIVEISALNRLNLNVLLEKIFDVLPEREKLVDASALTQPGLNLDSKTFISEIIREKAFLFLRKEIPYSLTTQVEEVTERENGTIYIKAKIITSAERYKSMIVGKRGWMIKEISMAARKELETASNKKVYLELTVDVDPHWVDQM